MKPHRLIIAFLAIVLLANLTAADALAQDPEWLVLDEVAVTFYGPEYAAGDVTASGIRYTPDNDTVALGPYHLALVRDYYDEPFRWWRNRDGELRYRAPAACYPVLVTRTEVRWWGCMVRVCAGAAAGERLCRWLRVADTGAAALEVDLPDRTWERWGWPAERGVFTGTLEVIRW